MRCGRCEVIASTLSWWLGSMIATVEPQRSQNSRSLATAGSDVPGTGVRMHQRCSKRSPKPASGPECSVRSEEYTSELQSLMRISYAVFCLYKTNIIILHHTPTHPHMIL